MTIGVSFRDLSRRCCVDEQSRQGRRQEGLCPNHVGRCIFKTGAAKSDQKGDYMEGQKERLYTVPPRKINRMSSSTFKPIKGTAIT